jgi:hypothetical protein
MNSFTLFGHIVDAVGAATCQRSHIELEAAGLLPSDNYLEDDIQELTQQDADVRAAFAVWTGCAPRPNVETASKLFFNAVHAGAKVPTGEDGDNFVLHLADILRAGPVAHGVESVFIGHVIAQGAMLKGRASITYNDGSTVHYETGRPYPAEMWDGVTLDFKQLRAIHEDLTAPAGTWPARPVQPLRPLTFQGGAIMIQ